GSSNEKAHTHTVLDGIFCKFFIIEDPRHQHHEPACITQLSITERKRQQTVGPGTTNGLTPLKRVPCYGPSYHILPGHCPHTRASAPPWGFHHTTSTRPRCSPPSEPPPHHDLPVTRN
ncbi:unnamed protein product, partial [Ectocarpus fasciculatus]